MNDLKRTPSEIKARMGVVDDLFGTQSGDLLEFLPYEHAQPYLKVGVSPAQWDEAKAKMGPLAMAREYLPFAWEKANGCRGLSAARSMYHFQSWLWLAGIDDPDLENYEQYGKPQLVMISEALDFDWRAHDNGIWSDDEVYSIEDGIGVERRDALITEWSAKGAELKETLDGLR